MLKLNIQCTLDRYYIKYVYLLGFSYTFMYVYFLCFVSFLLFIIILHVRLFFFYSLDYVTCHTLILEKKKKKIQMLGKASETL